MLSIDDGAANVMTTVALFVIAAAVLYLARGAFFTLRASISPYPSLPRCESSGWDTCRQTVRRMHSPISRSRKWEHLLCIASKSTGLLLAKFVNSRKERRQQLISQTVFRTSRLAMFLHNNSD